MFRHITAFINVKITFNKIRAYNIPFASDANYLSNLLPMQMFGHRIKYLFEIIFAALSAMPPNRLGIFFFRVRILSFYHAHDNKLLSLVCVCLCIRTISIFFFHEESSCIVSATMQDKWSLQT